MQNYHIMTEKQKKVTKKRQITVLKVKRASSATDKLKKNVIIDTKVVEKG